MPVCGCTCTPPTRLVGFWGIVFLDASVWGACAPPSTIPFSPRYGFTPSPTNEQWYPSPPMCPHCPHLIRRQKLPRPHTLHNPTLLCVIPHPSRHRGSFRQDRIGVFITGVLEAVRTRPGTQPKAKCSPSSPQGVVILYLCTRHLHRRSSGFDRSFILFYFYLVSSLLTILYYFPSTPTTFYFGPQMAVLTGAPSASIGLSPPPAPLVPRD